MNIFILLLFLTLVITPIMNWAQDVYKIRLYYRIHSTAVSPYRCITHIASHMADHTCTLHYTLLIWRLRWLILQTHN